jgi:hypothetical protein
LPLEPSEIDMRTDQPSAVTTAPAATRVVVISLAALAVAMGIGRFAFTPLLPFMLRERWMR